MFSYTIFIMLLPLLSFIVLGLAGMKMQHKVAGLIGTCSLGIVTILSYLTAFQYFGMDRVEGVYQTFVPYNFTWLPLGNLHFDLGILLDGQSAFRPRYPVGSYQCDDADCDLYGITDGSYLLIRLYAWREGIPALLRFPVSLHDVNAGLGSGHQHLPDVYVLGVGGCIILPAHRILLSFEACHCCL